MPSSYWALVLTLREHLVSRVSSYFPIGKILLCVQWETCVCIHVYNVRVCFNMLSEKTNTISFSAHTCSQFYFVCKTHVTKSVVKISSDVSYTNISANHGEIVKSVEYPYLRTFTRQTLFKSHCCW